MNIAFFDSGIGGLTVLREALKLLPNENYIYYADTDNAPYGIKARNEVKTLTLNAVKFLANKNIKALVVACNTATSAAIEDLRERYSFPVIGMEPAIKPAIKKSSSDGKRVLVLATSLTLKEEKFQNLISRVDTGHIVDILPVPRLVEFAENFTFQGLEVERYLKDSLPWYNINNYGAIVLGCTHFPLFKKTFSNILPPGIEIIDGNAGTINHLYEILKEENLLNPSFREGQIVYYKSGIQVKDQVTKNLYNSILKL